MEENRNQKDKEALLENATTKLDQIKSMIEKGNGVVFASIKKGVLEYLQKIRDDVMEKEIIYLCGISSDDEDIIDDFMDENWAKLEDVRHKTFDHIIGWSLDELKTTPPLYT